MSMFRAGQVTLCPPSKQSVFWSRWRTQKGKVPRCTSPPPSIHVLRIPGLSTLPLHPYPSELKDW